MGRHTLDARQNAACHLSRVRVVLGMSAIYTQPLACVGLIDIQLSLEAAEVYMVALFQP